MDFATLPRGSARIVPAALVAATLVACGDDDLATPPAPLDITVSFAAEVNGVSFACGQSYAGVGTSGTTITPVDFRFYVHDVRLVDDTGTEVPVELDQAPVWQHQNLALLDFEDGSGPCTNGTSDTNGAVTGTVPGGATYTGLRFTLGVPFELNHIDQTTAPAPLDLTALFWAWNGGYKFARLDHVSDAQPQGWNVHLGSTGCTPNDSPQTVPTSCANEHRVEVSFDGFDVADDVVVADLGRLLAGADPSVNAPQTARGCMSFPGDEDCPPVMNAFGLDYEGSPASGQSFFSAR
jgi:uncharacterized repeat protein (TIGR04052 family)